MKHFLIVQLAFGLAALGLVSSDAHAAGTATQVYTYIIEGDTQNWAFSSSTATRWRRLHEKLCSSGASRILSTGDIVNYASSAGEWAFADAAYDVTDACNLAATLPAGNHDIIVGGATTFAYYDAFLRSRPLHRPLARSPSGHSWVDRLEPDLVVAVLPFVASSGEVAWLENWLAAHPSERAILLKHDAISPSTGARLGAVSTLSQRFGSRIAGVIGGHYVPSDRVRLWVTSSGSFSLFSNFQLGTDLGSQPEGLVTVLDHYLPSDMWCVRTMNYLTGEADRFEPPRCF